MPGVRWRTVIPLTVAIFTLVALRNLFIYSDHLPTSNSNHESGSSNELIGLIMRRRHVEPDDVADEEPDEDNRRQDVNNVNNVRKRGRQQAVRVNAFQLFPEDEPVKPIANEPQEPSQLLKSGKDVEVRQQPEVFINRRNKEPDDTPDKEENSNVKNARQVEEVDSNKKSKDDADSRQEEEEVNLKPANRDNKIRDMRLSMLNDGNSSMHEDALIMANMGQVGQIVRKMKQTRNDDETDKHDSHSRQYSPVNPHPFEYVINSPKLCADESVFLVVYVHTAPEHYKRRTVIRQTWGDVGQYEVNVKLVFVAGVTAANDDEKMQNALLFEAEQYGDIVQENFIDTYHNLTYKGIAALRWIDSYCGQAVFVLKTDDDIFVNMYTLIRYLKKMSRTVDRPRSLLMCLVWESMPVLREGKWKVTKEEWPDDSYPTYCSGSAFVMSTDVARSMYRVSYDVPFFWVDDFYITGLLPLKLGNVTHRQFASTYVLNGDLLEDSFTGSQWYTYVFSHVHNLDRIQSVWQTLTRLAKGQAVATIQSRRADGKHRPKRPSHEDRAT